MSTSPSLLHVRRPSPSSSDLLSSTVVPSTVLAKPCLPPLETQQNMHEDQVEVVLNASASCLSMSDPAESSISIDTTDIALSSSPQSTLSETSTTPSRFSSRSAFKSFFIEALTGVTGVSSSTSSENNLALKREVSLPEGVLGYALSKDAWTPDGDALSCFHPSCPVTFSALSISNRRHHCRMCGQIYCAAHTARSAPLLLPSSTVRAERVCEACIEESSSSNAQITSAASSAISLTDLALESPARTQQPHVTRAAFRPSFHRSHSNPSTHDTRVSRLPIQPWMDGQGVLSLYPLATKRSRRALSPNEPSAAAPLFQAPLSDSKKFKSNAINDSEFVPANWGYKREAFDESYQSQDEDDDDEATKGGLVVNGPFMLRAHPERQARKSSSPPNVLAGVTKAYAGDWSTF